MKATFVGYYTPSEDDFVKLWAEARIIVDANVLLAAYGVSDSTRDALLSLLERLRDRLWIPHQFALEYQRNRLGKILEQVKNYDEAHQSLKTILDEQIRSRNRHPFVSAHVDRGLEDSCKNLEEGKNAQEKLLKADPHFERTTRLFEGRVGAPYSDVELNRCYEEASKRYDAKTPPGFKDLDKPVPARYGDYVGWRQILDFVAKNGVSVILVTDDAKDDWWRKEGSLTFGPRPELIVEFKKCCSELFHMYSSDRFLELSAKYVGQPVDRKAISELKERRESEPPPDALKATGVAQSDGLVAKSTGYPSDRDANEEKTVLDSPKTSVRAQEKPEAK